MIVQRLLAVSSLLAVGVLAGCATTSTPTPTTPATSGSATPTPSATADQLPDDTLFRISAVLTATTGQSVRLVETVRAPTTGDGTEPATMATARCDSWQAKYPTPEWVTVDVVSTVLSGFSWPTSADSILVRMDGLDAFPAFSGSGLRTYQAYCSAPLANVPGVATIILPIDPSAPIDSPLSWGGRVYGFSWGADGASAADAPFTVTNCTLQKGIAASASAKVTAWDPSAPSADGGYPSCQWGSQA